MGRPDGQSPSWLAVGRDLAVMRRLRVVVVVVLAVLAMFGIVLAAAVVVTAVRAVFM
jgi:hypothetical protein